MKPGGIYLYWKGEITKRRSKNKRIKPEIKERKKNRRNYISHC